MAADLVGESDGVAPEWVPTTAADVWAAGGPEIRWSALARTWLDLPRLPGLVGRKDDAGRPISALSDGVRRPLAPRDRRRVLAGLAELPPGTAPGSAAALADLLAWRAPRRGGRLRDEVVAWVLAEATVLGVVALDAHHRRRDARCSTDPDRLVAALRVALPEPVDHVLLQADLTAVAPGPLETELARELDLVAEVESAGGATVYRFTEATVRRALDAGRTAADLHELFAKRSATPVPQGLTYLVDDVARRHGRLRGGVAASFLRSDDEVLIAEVLAHPESTALELRRIAPTVLVSPLPLVELLDGLRGRRVQPGRRGHRRSRARPDRPGPAHRAPPPRHDPHRSVPTRTRSSSPRWCRACARATRWPGSGAALPPPSPPTAPRSTCSAPPRQPAAASGSGSWTRTGWRASGCWRRTRVGGGVVEGRDAVDGDVHRVPLHRITSIALVEDPERP